MSYEDCFSKLRGGAVFDTKRYGSDIELFHSHTKKSSSPKKLCTSSTTSPYKDPDDLPKALRFFGQVITEQTQPQSQEIKRKRKRSELDEQEKEENQEEATPVPAKRRKTSKQDSVDELPATNTVTVSKPKIKVQGSDATPPITSFTDLNERFKLPTYLKKNIESAKFQYPTPVQTQCLPLFMQAREVLGIAPTGSGKTAAFVIPILYLLKKPAKVGFRAVVLSPTKELAQQTYRVFKQFTEGRGFRVCVLVKAVADAHSMTNSRFDILVSTPLRLVNMIKQEAIKLANVQILVLDEADRLFDESFIGQVDEVIAACKGLIQDRLATKNSEQESAATTSQKPIQVCMFSATISPQVEQLVSSVMRDPVRVFIGARNIPNTAVSQKLVFVGTEQGKLLAMRDLISQGLHPPVLVFVQSKERAQELFRELVYDEINVEVIHSDRTQFQVFSANGLSNTLQRDAIVDSFRQGKIWVLIATDVMARGMDFKGISQVINYDFPTSVTSYIHRIGRTGRAGRTGEAVTFFTEEDADSLRSIASVMRESGCEIPEWMLKIRKTPKQRKKELARRPVEREAISMFPATKVVVPKPTTS